ncbi:MAG: cytochrome c [Pseudomonadota bacterium]
MRTAAFALSVAALAATGSSLAQQSPADAYNVCAACHLPTGAGIPGAFPPIRKRGRQIAVLEGGREYLIGTVLNGLMGQISAGGQSYFGVMAGQRGAMDHESIAQALNYVMFELADDDGSEVAAFTADEVAGVAEQWGAAGPDKAAKVRQQLVEKHADAWPK